MSLTGLGAALNVIDGVAATLKNAKQGYDHVNASIHGRGTISASNHARLNFHTVYSSAVQPLSWHSDISQTILRMQIGFWLQAAQSLTTIGQVSLHKKLDPLNPSRDISLDFALEGLGNRPNAPRCDPFMPLPGVGYGLSLTAAADGLRYTAESINLSQRGTEPNQLLENRVVPGIGRLFSVRVCEGTAFQDVLVAARLSEEYHPGSTLVDVMTADAPMEYDMGERARMVMSGTLGLIDFLTCRDIHRRRLRNQMKDKSGLLSRIQSDIARHQRASFASGQSSVAARAGTLVLTNTEARALEARVGMRFSSMSNRQDRLFDPTTFQMVMVVTPEAERVELYFDSIRDVSVFSLKQMQEGNKGSGDSIVDVMRTLMQSQAPKY